jgi:3-hydroxyisobutyrate dehydrogenase
MTDLAFLGTGVMGAPMALRCNEEGFAVHAWNRSADKVRPLAAEGVQVFGSAAEAARDCPVMVTMLADADAVLDVAAAVLDAPGSPEVWLQMSTIGPEGTERCAGLAEAHDVAFVDAPVLGTRAPAEQGALVVLASGPESARPAADPVFDAVGARTMWLGEAGVASRAKLMLNSWVLGIVGALAETLSLARVLDLDPQIFFDAIEGGALDLPYAHVKGGAMAAESFDDVSFALSLARKDAGLVLDGARAHGLQLGAMADIAARLRQAEADGHGDADMAAIFLARSGA